LPPLDAPSMPDGVVCQADAGRWFVDADERADLDRAVKSAMALFRMPASASTATVAAQDGGRRPETCFLGLDFDPSRTRATREKGSSISIFTPMLADENAQAHCADIIRALGDRCGGDGVGKHFTGIRIDVQKGFDALAVRKFHSSCDVCLFAFDSAELSLSHFVWQEGIGDDEITPSLGPYKFKLLDPLRAVVLAAGQVSAPGDYTAFAGVGLPLASGTRYFARPCDGESDVVMIYMYSTDRTIGGRKYYTASFDDEMSILDKAGFTPKLSDEFARRKHRNEERRRPTDAIQAPSILLRRRPTQAARATAAPAATVADDDAPMAVPSPLLGAASWDCDLGLGVDFFDGSDDGDCADGVFDDLDGDNDVEGLLD
jgi:hypothetical protein